MKVDEVTEPDLCTKKILQLYLGNDYCACLSLHSDLPTLIEKHEEPKFKVPTADEKQEYGGRSIVGCSSLIVVV